MAANPLLSCNPATSWYDFTFSLSWSHICEVAEVLSNIPLISMGVLVFGVSPLFLVMKRVSISTVWLFFSTLLAFIAGVLDLGQTLADGMAADTTLTAPNIRARELLFAFSTGFRFLFYWSYVAEPSRKYLSVVPTQSIQTVTVNFLALECPHDSHSGSWTRWGWPGKLLRVGFLLIIIIITALQIVWRMVPRFHQYSSVYGTDAALELLISFLLLLRVLLNTVTFNSPDNMMVHTFKECLAPISGLLINIAIGVGNLLCFAFTESTVGRLLQAFEVYIIVVFATLITFLRHRDTLLSVTSLQIRKHKDAVFTLPEPVRGSTFRITLPFIETPHMSSICGAANQTNASSREVFSRSARRSLNHVSSWVSSRVSGNRARHKDEEVRLWNTDGVKVDPPCTGNIVAGLVHSSVSPTQEPKGLTELVRKAPANHISVVSALDAQSVFVRSVEGSIHSGHIQHPSRTDAAQRTISSPIHSGARRAGSMAVTSKASPIYGLSGIQPFASPSDSQISLDELLRQQSQLDQSIEALKLFSARTSVNLSHTNSITNPRSVELSRSPSTGQRTVSSEVSLSSFPIPPWLTNPVPPPPSSSPSPVKRTRWNRRPRFVSARFTPLQDPQVSVSPIASASPVDIPSSPRFNGILNSPLGEDNEALSARAGKCSRSDSGGTQYNVTSFIGGLATPGEPTRQSSEENPWWLVEPDYSVEVVQTSSGVKKVPPRMPAMPRRHEGPPASSTATELSPLARSSKLFEGDVNKPMNFLHYRINGQARHTPPVVHSLHTHSDHVEKGVAIPSTRSQPVRETVSTQKMFVRPRPPPLALQSCTERNTGISRVQVLVDD